MSKKEDYSQQYNFHVSHLSLGQDKVSMLSQSHGPLTTRDIDGAQPRKFTSQRTPDRDCFKLHESEESSSEGRSIFRAPSHPRNPLDPEYDLPPAFIPPAEEMKFVRDTLDTSDIPGTRPREPRRYIERSRYTLNNEIQEEKSKLKRGCWEDQLRNNLDVTDINLKSNPNRETNRKIIVRATDALDTVGQQNSIQGKFDRYSTIREVNKRAKSAIDDALSLICSFEPKIDVSFIRTLERECRHLDRDRSGMLKSEEIVDAVDRSMSLKLPPDEAIKLLNMLTAASPSGFVEYKHILTELYKIYEQENECSTPHSSELEVPAWYSARRRRQKDEIGCIIQLIH